jgi:hypothetical protein
MAGTEPTAPATPASSRAPGPTHGRRPETELAGLRERIEQLRLAGLTATAIHRALTGPESPNPIVLSARQVRAHMRAIERGWAARSSPETLEADRARAAARLEDAMRTALGRSTLNGRSNVGLGYLNTYLKAQDQWVRLRGLDAPTRTELSGPGGTALTGSVALADHPAEHLDSREEARRLRQMAADREAEAEADEEEERLT